MKISQLTATVLLLVIIQVKGIREMSNCGLIGPKLMALMANSTITHRWPWHTAIYHRFYEAELIYKCGGTVISSNVILTAAHCVSRSGVRMKITQILVSLGRLSLNESESSAPYFTIDKIIIHQKFNIDDLNNDIAIIRTSTDMAFNNYVQPICLWRSDKTDLSEVIGKNGTVIGWGHTETGELSNVLRIAYMPVVSWGNCLESNRAFGGNYLSAQNFCAGVRNGTSVCSGDSGGSMTFKVNDVYYIRGIVSSTPGKNQIYDTTQIVCDSMEYAIFTDVAQHLEWIENTTATITECETKVQCAWYVVNQCPVALHVGNPAQRCKITFDVIPNLAITELRTIIGESNYIPDLSDALTKFENLESLSLENIKMKIVERTQLAPFSRITTLCLSFNRITRLDGDTFNDLRNLTKLRLDTNQLKTLPADTFNSSRNIREISLANNQFKEFPIDLFRELRSLEKLWLTGNKIETLPADIFRYNKNMLQVFLSLNQFKELNVNLFSALENLEEIFLNDNSLQSLPPHIFRENKKVRHIRLNNNQLETLHVDVFASLHSLETLVLTANALGDLPADVFNNNKQLKELILDENKLAVLHVDIFKELHNLQKLALANNKLETLPPSIFRNNRNMRIILLYANQLKELNSDLFIELPNLETLWLSENKIENLPDGLFRYNDKLINLHLQENQIKKIDSDFHNMPQLVILDFRGNVCINEDCNVSRFCGTSSVIEMNEKIHRNCTH